MITLRIEEQAQQVLLQVEDNGIGIPRALLPLLFDRFTKAKRPGVRGEPPIGLGMSITKHIVELHGGEIRVESQENQGTIVTITLPKA